MNSSDLTNTETQFSSETLQVLIKLSESLRDNNTIKAKVSGGK